LNSHQIFFRIIGLLLSVSIVVHKMINRSTYINTANSEKIEILQQQTYVALLKQVKQMVLSQHGSEKDAEDILHDGILIYIRCKEANKIDKQLNPEGYLFTICKNLWYNKAKRDKKTTSLQLEEPIVTTNIIDEIINKEREQAIQETLGKIGNKCKELLHKSFFGNNSDELLYVSMGYKNADAFKTQKYKCKQKLLEAMKKHPYFKQN